MNFLKIYTSAESGVLTIIDSLDDLIIEILHLYNYVIVRARKRGFLVV